MATERTVLHPFGGVIYVAADKQYQHPFGGVIDGKISAGVPAAFKAYWARNSNTIIQQVTR